MPSQRITPRIWFLLPLIKIWLVASGSFSWNKILMGLLRDIKSWIVAKGSPKSRSKTIMIRLVLLLSPPPYKWFYILPWILDNLFANLMLTMPSWMETIMRAYMAQPLGFFDASKPSHFYCLHKAIHGFKQASQVWYIELKTFLIEVWVSQLSVLKPLYSLIMLIGSPFPF